MNNTVKKITILGMLLAAEVVASRFISVSLPLVKIGFGFLPLSITAMLFGPLWAGAAAVLSDFMVAMMGPYGYYPPMAISALCTGIIYGLFLHKKPVTTWKIFLCVATQSILVSIFLQTYWLTLLTGKGYLALLSTRIAQNLITIPIDALCIRLVSTRVVDMVEKGGIRISAQN